jgi:hypothetical protein
VLATIWTRAALIGDDARLGVGGLPAVAQSGSSNEVGDAWRGWFGPPLLILVVVGAIATLIVMLLRQRRSGTWDGGLSAGLGCGASGIVLVLSAPVLTRIGYWLAGNVGAQLGFMAALTIMAAVGVIWFVRGQSR